MKKVATITLASLTLGASMPRADQAVIKGQKSDSKPQYCLMSGMILNQPSKEISMEFRVPPTLYGQQFLVQGLTDDYLFCRFGLETPYPPYSNNITFSIWQGDKHPGKLMKLVLGKRLIPPPIRVGDRMFIGMYIGDGKMDVRAFDWNKQWSQPIGFTATFTNTMEFTSSVIVSNNNVIKVKNLGSGFARELHTTNLNAQLPVQWYHIESPKITNPPVIFEVAEEETKTLGGLNKLIRSRFVPATPNQAGMIGSDNLYVWWLPGFDWFSTQSTTNYVRPEP